MAPITDDIVAELQNTIKKLESKVKALESRLGGGNASPSSTMRMVLMGPPGAGKSDLSHHPGRVSLAYMLLQARERKRHGSKTDTASATWYD